VEIGAAAGLPSGDRPSHPCPAGNGRLADLALGEIDPRAEGRPARRYYHLTPWYTLADGTQRTSAG